MTDWWQYPLFQELALPTMLGRCVYLKWRRSLFHVCALYGAFQLLSIAWHFALPTSPTPLSYPQTLSASVSTSTPAANVNLFQQPLLQSFSRRLQLARSPLNGPVIMRGPTAGPSASPAVPHDSQEGKHIYFVVLWLCYTFFSIDLNVAQELVLRLVAPAMTHDKANLHSHQRAAR